MTYEENPIVLNSISEIEELRLKIEFLGDEISKLQNQEDKIEYFHCLYALAEKYENLYTRACLDESEGSAELKNSILHDLRAVAYTHPTLPTILLV